MARISQPREVAESAGLLDGAIPRGRFVRYLWAVPKDPKQPDARTPWREREGELATEERREVKRPTRFKVVLYNDNYTPMEFVAALLEQVFGKSPAEATQLMLKIHRGGQGIAGVYVLEVAETKVAVVHRHAEERGYPLRSGVEAE